MDLAEGERRSSLDIWTWLLPFWTTSTRMPRSERAASIEEQRLIIR